MSATSGAPLLSTLQRKAARRAAREDRKSQVEYVYGVEGLDGGMIAPRRERRARTEAPAIVTPYSNRSDAPRAKTERARRVRAQRAAVKLARIEARP